MPLLHFYDRVTIMESLLLPLEPELHQLLSSRVAHLTAAKLLDMSEIVVIGPDTTEHEIVAAIGFTPMVGLDGHRFGQPGFCTMLEYVVRVSSSYHEAIVAVGNSGFAFQLLVHDAANAELVALCRDQVA